jgi:hypothetical protein
MATPDAGAYLIQASQTGLGGEVRGEGGWVAPYPAEYRQVGVDAALLAKVAAAGGGRVLADAAEAMRPPDEAAAARWPAAQLLLVLAAICWPLEIAARRLSIPTAELGVLARAARLRVHPSTNGRHGVGGPASPPGSAPTVATAQRLLQRKQAFRERRR